MPKSHGEFAGMEHGREVRSSDGDRQVREGEFGDSEMIGIESAEAIHPTEEGTKGGGEGMEPNPTVLHCGSRGLEELARIGSRFAKPLEKAEVGDLDPVRSGKALECGALLGQFQELGPFERYWLRKFQWMDGDIVALTSVLEIGAYHTTGAVMDDRRQSSGLVEDGAQERAHQRKNRGVVDLERGKEDANARLFRRELRPEAQAVRDLTEPGPRSCKFFGGPGKEGIGRGKHGSVVVSNRREIKGS